MNLPLYTLTILSSFSIQHTALVPVPELCKLQQSWTDLWTFKSICENWQLGENHELQHQGACIQNCTLADFWKDLLSISILFMLGKTSWKQILRGSFSESGFGGFLSLCVSLDKMEYLFYINWWNFSKCFLLLEAGFIKSFHTTSLLSFC